MPSPLSPVSPEWFYQMVSVPLPECDPQAIGRRLRQEHHIEVPTLRWQEKNLLRVSVQGYNTPADLETLYDAVTRVLPA